MLRYIDLGFIKIGGYSLMLFLGVVAFTLTTLLILEKKERLPIKTVNKILIICIFGFAGMGASAFLFNSLFHSIEQGRIVLGGITWLGGVIGGFPLTVYLLHRFCPEIKGNALNIFNYFIPGIVLAHAFGRMGCFLGGCCYGGVTDSVFGMVFPKGSPAAVAFPDANEASLPVYPTQLFEAVFEVILFLAMMIGYKKGKTHFCAMYAVTYGVFRFLLEFLREDDRGATGFAMSPSQLMSIVVIIGGILIFLYRKGYVFKKLYAKMQTCREIAATGATATKASTTEQLTDTVRAIRELKALADEGIITQEEFAAKKEELLARL